MNSRAKEFLDRVPSTRTSELVAAIAHAEHLMEMLFPNITDQTSQADMGTIMDAVAAELDKRIPPSRAPSSIILP